MWHCLVSLLAKGCECFVDAARSALLLRCSNKGALPTQTHTHKDDVYIIEMVRLPPTRHKLCHTLETNCLIVGSHIRLRCGSMWFKRVFRCTDGRLAQTVFSLMAETLFARRGCAANAELQLGCMEVSAWSVNWQPRWVASRSHCL